MDGVIQCLRSEARMYAPLLRITFGNIWEFASIACMSQVTSLAR